MGQAKAVLQTTFCRRCNAHGIGTTAGRIYTRSGPVRCLNGEEQHPRPDLVIREWVEK